MAIRPFLLFLVLLLSSQTAHGAASYVYDSLNNITAKSIGTRNVSAQYDTGTNRLSAVQDSADGLFRQYSYDTRGNTTGRGWTGWLWTTSTPATPMPMW